MYLKKTHIHFVGIGGIGMSGIATILQQQGYTISGCDKEFNQHSIKNLQALGCSLFEGNNTPFCNDHSINFLVYSSAIQKENPEIVHAQKRGIPTISRAEMLIELMRTKYSIAIAGSHGKTTTSSLLSHIFIEAEVDPTIIIGGHLNRISTNARLGNGAFLIAEADESDRSLELLRPTIGLVTNISLEHLETYQDLDDISNTFKRFLKNIPFYGSAIICMDDPNAKKLLCIPNLKTVSYGLSPAADILATNIKLHPTYSEYTLCIKDIPEQFSVRINMPGEHNIQNSLGAIAITQELKLPIKTVITAIENFTGVDRRFSFRGVFSQGVELFDDYGHHPVEIEKTVDIAKARSKGRLVIAFQPHRFTRTKALWDQFVLTLSSNRIDHLIVTDIYPASEEPILNISSEQLALDIKKFNPDCSVEYVPLDTEFKQIKNSILNAIKPNDLLLIQGAGDLYKIATNLL